MIEQRRRLRDLTLNGRRAFIRGAQTQAVIIAAAIGLVGYVLPAHSVHGGPFHSNFDDGGVGPLLVFIAVGALTFALRRRRLGAGIATGIVASGGAILALAPVLLVHLFSRVEQGPGEPLFAVGIVGLFVTGVIVMVSEPMIYIFERRVLEREDADRIPSARVVS